MGLQIAELYPWTLPSFPHLYENKSHSSLWTSEIGQAYTEGISFAKIPNIQNILKHYITNLLDMERRIFRLLLKFSFVFTNCKEKKTHEFPPAWQGIRVLLLTVGKHHLLHTMFKWGDQAKLKRRIFGLRFKVTIGTHPVSSTPVHNIL